MEPRAFVRLRTMLHAALFLSTIATLAVAAHVNFSSRFSEIPTVTPFAASVATLPLLIAFATLEIHAQGVAWSILASPIYELALLAGFCLLWTGTTAYTNPHWSFSLQVSAVNEIALGILIWIEFGLFIITFLVTLEHAFSHTVTGAPHVWSTPTRLFHPEKLQYDLEPVPQPSGISSGPVEITLPPAAAAVHSAPSTPGPAQALPSQLNPSSPTGRSSPYSFLAGPPGRDQRSGSRRSSGGFLSWKKQPKEEQETIVEGWAEGGREERRERVQRGTYYENFAREYRNAYGRDLDPPPGPRGQPQGWKDDGTAPRGPTPTFDEIGGHSPGKPIAF